MQSVNGKMLTKIQDIDSIFNKNKTMAANVRHLSYTKQGTKCEWFPYINPHGNVFCPDDLPPNGHIAFDDRIFINTHFSLYKTLIIDNHQFYDYCNNLFQ
jgi:hypothetical protein